MSRSTSGAKTTNTHSSTTAHHGLHTSSQTQPIANQFAASSHKTASSSTSIKVVAQPTKIQLRASIHQEQQVQSQMVFKSLLDELPQLVRNKCIICSSNSHSLTGHCNTTKVCYACVQSNHHVNDCKSIKKKQNLPQGYCFYCYIPFDIFNHEVNNCPYGDCAYVVCMYLFNNKNKLRLLHNDFVNVCSFDFPRFVKWMMEPKCNSLCNALWVLFLYIESLKNVQQS